MTQMLQQAERTRIKTIQSTSNAKRHELAQHLTPPETASLAVSLYSEMAPNQKFIRCLDLGAGTGMLSVALYERYDGHIEQLDAVEADPVLASLYEAEMATIGVPHETTLGDALLETPRTNYDRIILNPPYRKMRADDPRQEKLPCRSANLYSAFMAIGLSRLAEDGELVAIVPRSWTNGEYFTPFRKYALGNFSLDAIHVYGSRTEIFKDTDVLQETMLVKFSRRPQAQKIRVSQSADKTGAPIAAEHDASELIDPQTLVVRIAPPKKTIALRTVASVGLCPSTGKVVDFRNRERTFVERPNGNDIFRLIYAGNFKNGSLVHPGPIGKPQWFRADNTTSRKQLVQPGSYTVVKRFSSKEERRRVVAYPLVTDEPIAIENHLNVIHSGISRSVTPLKSAKLACGIAIWLNTMYIDEWFRDVGGSTQVNAGDIKSMPCPPLEALETVGAKWHQNMAQEEIDRICEAIQ